MNDIILITGASSGFGKATAKRFADSGATVIITGRDEMRLETAAAQTGAVPFCADATQPSDWKALREFKMCIRDRRHTEAQSLLLAVSRERGAQMRVRSDAAGYRDIAKFCQLHRHVELFEYRRNYRFSKRSGDILAAVFLVFLFAVVQMVDDRRLESAERKVEVVADDRGRRKFHRVGISERREPIHLGSARIGQTHDPTDLVERLSDCVVTRVTDRLKVGVTVYVYQ